MAGLVLKQLIQLSQDGESIWATDETGAYDVDDNEGGWGDPNFELNQSALAVIGFRESIQTEYNQFIDSQIKFSNSYENDDIITFNMQYLNDGVHSFYLIRMYVSENDATSLENYTFVNGDIWYNSISRTVKQLLSAGVIVTLNLADDDDVNAIISSGSVVKTLCEYVFANKLTTLKNDISLKVFESRRGGVCEGEPEMIRDQMTILLAISSANYSFSFGLKQEAQRIMETTMENFSVQ